MNDQQKATRIAGMTESAFGRPANWWTAWPALAVGLCAFLIAVYGTWWLPKRLPEQYAHALVQAQQQYQLIAEKTKTSGGPRLIDAAGDMDVIYSRLVDLEKNSPKRYWQWAEFQQAHAQLLNMTLKDPALSLSPPIRERWTEQAQHFQSKSEEILDQLAVRPSELQAKAMLHVAHRKYLQGLSEFGVREASELADEVSQALDSADSTTYDSVDKTASLTQDEIEAGHLLLVQLHIEAAWQADARSKLTCDTTQLEQAWELLERFQSKQQSTAHRLEWQVTLRLLMALTGKHFNVAENDADAMDLGSDGRDAPPAWKSDLAKLQLAAIDGDWIEVANQLRSRIDPLEPVVTSGLARTICRLTVSPLASAPQKTGADVGQGEQEGERGVGERGERGEERNDAERRATLNWAEDAGMGVLLAAQLGAHLPECSELLWECARLQAGQGTERIVVPAAIPQSIMSGQSGWLKHSLAALSATLDGQAAVAHTHLQLLSRTQGSPPLVARVALWRTQVLSTDDAAPTGELDQPTLEELIRLRELLRSVVQLEPNHGLNWFVLGTLQFRTGEFKAMRDSLDKARELLGDVPAIEQMLDAAEGIPSDR